MPQGRIQDLAKTLYERYINQSGGLNYEGKPCPEWYQLPNAIHINWIAVADEATKQISPSTYKATHQDLLPEPGETLPRGEQRHGAK